MRRVFVKCLTSIYLLSHVLCCLASDTDVSDICTEGVRDGELVWHQLCKRPHFVDNIFPSYGPVAGGTPIVVKSKAKSLFVQMTTRESTTINCSISDSSFHRVCTTPPSQNASTGVVNFIIVTVMDNITEKINFKFEYKENPKVFSATPLASFIVGGVALYVNGVNLNSSCCPIVVIITKFRGNANEVFYERCSHVNDTVMKCSTPAVSLPPEINSNLERGHISNHIFRTWVGFVFDGVEEFSNFAKIEMYTTPQISEFQERDRLRWYNAKETQTIDIEASELYSLWRNQTSVKIGYNATCHVTLFAVNMIRCQPPLQRTIEDPNVQGPYNNPAVIVNIGSNLAVNVGYLTWDYEDVRPWSQTSEFKGIVSLAVIMLGGAFAALYFVRRRRQVTTLQKRGRARANVYELEMGLIRSRSFNELLPLLDPDLVFKMEQALIEPDRLTLGPVVGSGHFGNVLQGNLAKEADGETEHATKVAVKTLKGAVGLEDLKAFLQEATLTIELCHENVLSTTGVAVKDDTPYAVLPFMENGDLKSFITDPQNVWLKAKDLIEFGLQVAKGMEYLDKHKFVHRDLAARNCMVDEYLVVKVADFGLSRDVYETEYYSVSSEQRPLPVKWMALESLTSGVFTTKTDVWSYGVLLWELLTRGDSPYADVSNFEMKDYLFQGRRLSKPAYAPASIFQMMLRCWLQDPNERPDFSSIVETVTEELDMLSPYEVPRECQVDAYLTPQSMK